MPGVIGASIFSPRPARGYRFHSLQVEIIVVPSRHRRPQSFSSNYSIAMHRLCCDLNALLRNRFRIERLKDIVDSPGVTDNASQSTANYGKCCSSVALVTLRASASRDRDRDASAAHACGKRAAGRKIGDFKKFTGGDPCRAKLEIDQVLRQKSDAREIPGVVAMAANQQRGDLSGRVRQTRPVQGRRHDARQRVLDRLDDQGDHRGRRHATGRARQALARRADRQGAARSRLPAGARRLRCQGRTKTAAGEEPDHAAPSHDPHRRLLLRYVERRHGAVSGKDRPARRHHLQERRAENAADDRSRHALGIRHQYRLRRQGGRSGERQAARCLFARPPVHPARHDRHRLQDRGSAAQAPGRHARRADPTDRWRRSRSNSSRIRNSTWAAAASTAPRAITSSSPR